MSHDATHQFSGGESGDKDSSASSDDEDEISNERCFDEVFGEYIDCPNKEDDDAEVIENNNDDGDAILFPLFEVPLMTEEIESALTSTEGELFRDIWKGLFDSPDTVPLNIGKEPSLNTKCYISSRRGYLVNFLVCPSAQRNC